MQSETKYGPSLDAAYRAVLGSYAGPQYRYRPVATSLQGDSATPMERSDYTTVIAKYAQVPGEINAET